MQEKTEKQEDKENGRRAQEMTLKKGVAVWKEQGERVPEENTGLYKYSDLQMLVFIKIVLEG